MRKALVVGINYYDKVSSLNGCVDDAYAMNSVLERNSDGTINFDVKLLTGTGPTDRVTKQELKENIINLFSGELEIALFYFSGHGFIDATGGYIISSDSTSGDDGLSLRDILVYADKSDAQNRIIVLDSCYSGIAGESNPTMAVAELKKGTTILTASTKDQYAIEENGSGVFTTLFVDAMNGAAGNLVGDVSPGSVYAHIDQSLGGWEQRPVFKTNVESFVSLRKVQPPLELSDLQRISELFTSKGFEFFLDPSFEPERSSIDPDIPKPDPLKTDIFAILQKYYRVNLVIPVGAPHMWHAAMGSKSCKLTVLGEHYRKLSERGRL